MNGWVSFGRRCVGFLLLLTILFCRTAPAVGQDKPAPVFELRTYYAHPDKLDALHARFRDHTCKLFEKHGMTNVAYWTPIDNPQHKLIYLLSFPSNEARGAAWKASIADPQWQEVYKASEKDGPLVAKVESQLLTPTDFSPATMPKAEQPRVFELRIYSAHPGRLEGLLARFRDHTCKLFEKHGITNLAYFTLLPDQQDAEATLVYFLAHPSVEAAKKSFMAFGQDPDWTAARKESEEKAGGPLTIAGGVRSVFLQATDYSPLK